MSSTPPRPVMLVILDGFGLSADTRANAVALARKPNFDRLWNSCPHTTLVASGEDVGLPPGVMGNSEVGHLNIGAGRIVFQDSSLIDHSVATGEFFSNEVFLAAIKHVQTNGSRLHLLGLASNGGVHASEGHYLALLELTARHGLMGDKVVVHAFTDGRDTAPQSGAGFIAHLLERMVTTGSGCIGSVIGRFYAMDRDTRWPRVQAAYECLTMGKGHIAPDAVAAVADAYERGETDEFIGATAVQGPDGSVRPRIQSGDAVLLWNYRSDRGRELMQVFLDPDFDRDLPALPTDKERTRFKREVVPTVFLASMTRYSESQSAPYAFGPRLQHDGLGETVAKAGKAQLRIAETEKYPHVTFFFSGGMETPWAGEERVLVKSPEVKTYDLQPEMSSPEVTEKVVAAILEKRFDLIILNYAQTDMVGHTGVLEAAIKAVESADNGLGEIIPAVEKVGGNLLVIADHGNCEQEFDFEHNVPHTAHTTNLVPCVVFGAETETAKLRTGGRLADVAPTLLDLMGIPQPTAMTGKSLLREGEPITAHIAAAIAANTVGDRLQLALAGRINVALGEAEVLAGVAELEARLEAARN